MTGRAALLSDLSDLPEGGRIVTIGADYLALSDHPTLSDRKTNGAGKKQGWSPAEWRTRMLAAASSNGGEAAERDGDVREFELSLIPQNVAGAESTGRAPVLFPVQAAEVAYAAFAGLGLGPVLEIGQVDHDAREGAAMAAHFAAPPLPDPAAPEPLVEGLLRSAGQLPPSWSDPHMTPWPGAWCGCCGRHQRRGGRWWREAVAPKGWRCCTCHPPDGQPAMAIMEVRT